MGAKFRFALFMNKVEQFKKVVEDTLQSLFIQSC